jgi:hypothetical protein
MNKKYIEIKDWKDFVDTPGEYEIVFADGVLEKYIEKIKNGMAFLYNDPDAAQYGALLKTCGTLKFYGDSTQKESTHLELEIFENLPTTEILSNLKDIRERMKLFVYASAEEGIYRINYIRNMYINFYEN